MRHAHPVLAPSTEGAARRTGRPVLVVDDDDQIRSLVRATLEEEGFPVAEAGDGRAALEMAATVDPCLILLDMRMPVMDGWAFAAAYRERFAQRAPVVVMTAARDARAWADEVGADGVLPKPFDLDDLDAVVRRYC